MHTIDPDVKDENGDVGFIPRLSPLARASGAAKPYYAPRAVARKMHAAGLEVYSMVYPWHFGAGEYSLEDEGGPLDE